MKVKLYAVKDVLVGEFMNPVPMANDEVARRSLRIAANEPSAFKDNKQDIQLWYLGEFDNETGEFKENKPHLVGKLIDFIGDFDNGESEKQ